METNNASRCEKKNERKTGSRRFLFILCVIVVVVPGVMRYQKCRLEYQTFLSPGPVTVFKISTYPVNEDTPFRYFSEEDPALFAELGRFLPQAKRDGLILGIFGESYSIQYSATINYKTGWANLYLSPDEIYLSLPSLRTYFIRLDNPELHDYIWETYCSRPDMSPHDLP